MAPGIHHFQRARLPVLGSMTLWIAATGLMALSAAGRLRTATTLEFLRAVNPHLVAQGELAMALKVHSLMEDDLAFFRGTADLFYLWCGDHATDWLTHHRLEVRLHGDLHIGNIGTYRVASRTGLDLRFGIVDLDETIRGPYQLDLLRALTSLHFAAARGDFTFSQQRAASLAPEMCAQYQASMLAADRDSALRLEFLLVQQTLHEALDNEFDAYLAEYVVGDPLRFKSCRLNGDGAVLEVMGAVDKALSADVIDGLWSYLSGGTNETTRSLFRWKNRGQLAEGVLDVVSWVRLGSSGSQGLRKFLVLLDHPLIGTDQPLILQLKEEPTPAATRAGVLDSSLGIDRAAEVADAYGQLARPAKWLVGHTSIRGHGYLVKTKDPWGVELSPKDIHTFSDLKKTAGLMGLLLGRAHRTALSQCAGGRDAILEIGEDVMNQVPSLTEHSRDVTAYLRMQRRQLRSDPEAQLLEQRAEKYIIARPSEAQNQLVRDGQNRCTRDASEPKRERRHRSTDLRSLRNKKDPEPRHSAPAAPGP